MVGAKAFAIGYKVLGKKRSNPLLEKIHTSLPRLGREDRHEMNEMLHGTHVAEPFKLLEGMETRKGKPRNPVLEKMTVSVPAGQMDKPDIESRSVADLPHAELSRKVDATAKGIREILGFLKTFREEEKEEEEGVSSETIDRLTYRIFENIKSYLEKGHNMDRPAGNRQVRIELNI